jgi:hypothetical protein
METEVVVAGAAGCPSEQKDGKRLKRQPPPSHYNLMDLAKDKGQGNKAFSTSHKPHQLHPLRNGISVDVLDPSELRSFDKGEIAMFARSNKEGMRSPSFEEIAEATKTTVAFRE